MQFVTDPYAGIMYIVSPLAGGGGIVWRPHYRPHSLLGLGWCIELGLGMQTRGRALAVIMNVALIADGCPMMMMMMMTFTACGQSLQPRRFNQ